MTTPNTNTPSKNEEWTIGKLLDWTAGFLAKKGAESPRLDTEVLLAQAMNCKRIELYTRYTELASEEVRGRFRELIRKRTEGCPVAYLVGRKEFFSLPFEVNKSVLIPRAATETLVAECLKLAKEMQEPRMLDLGTGSGNIAVAVAHQHKTAQLTAVDISAEALEVAKRNAAANKVSERIRFLQGDLFAPLPPGQPFDFILSNPPYVAESDMARLEVGVRDYEPHVALSGGPGGLAVFDRIIDAARAYLKPGAWLLVEIGSTQETEARRRLGAIGGYEVGRTLADGEKHKRVVCAQMK